MAGLCALLLSAGFVQTPSSRLGRLEPGATAPSLLRVEDADAAQWLDALGVVAGAGERDSRERLIVVAADGKVTRIVDGQVSHITLSADLDRALAQPGAGLTLVHNHPASHGLSPDDLGQLGKAGVRMVVAVGHDYSMYAAMRGARFPAEGFEGLDDNAYRRARAQADRVLAGERDPRLRAAFDTHLHHVLGTALARAGILDYRARLGADRRTSFNDARLFLARVRDAAEVAARR